MKLIGSEVSIRLLGTLLDDGLYYDVYRVRYQSSAWTSERTHYWHFARGTSDQVITDLVRAYYIVNDIHWEQALTF